MDLHMISSLYFLFQYLFVSAYESMINQLLLGEDDLSSQSHCCHNKISAQMNPLFLLVKLVADITSTNKGQQKRSTVKFITQEKGGGQKDMFEIGLNATKHGNTNIMTPQPNLIRSITPSSQLWTETGW